MTKREAAIVSAYTGFLLGAFSDMHEYIEEIMERPVFTHEMGNKHFMEQLHEKTRPAFCAIVIDKELTHEELS